MSFPTNHNNFNNSNDTPNYKVGMQSDGYYRYPNGTPNRQNTGDQYHAPAPQYASPQPPKQEKPKKKGRAAAYVASILAVGLISGAAGGGATYYMMSQNGSMVQSAAQPEQTAATDNTDIPQSTSSAATPAAPKTENTGGIAGVVEKASGSVVEIAVQVNISNPFYGEMAQEGSGSGVIISEDGYIVTNNHVIDGASAIKVRTKDGTEYDGTLVGTDKQTDLAVVKIEATGLTAVEFADSDQVKVGETAIAIGNPLGTLGGTVTSGIVSALNRDITIDNQQMTLMQTSAAVNPGNSGGGLFNENGDLIGIVNAKSSGSAGSTTSVEGLGFAIPSNQVQTVSSDIIEHGYVTGRPEMGIKVIPIYDTQTAFYYRVNEYGVYVAEVLKENGLQVGDRIVKIDDKTIEAYADLGTSMDGKNVGDTVKVTVNREGKQVAVDVTLTESVPEHIQKQINAGANV